ncbi:Transposase [Enhygromyxa salina]|uniref:Transposase n=1 Tax=Enhygromyxa salina TaxID=215803 RepID=A0A0C2A3S2_9BACT|nr:VCBS repeat-containing protein [Enhygromyxa salina]KIG18033.1 Transposase [Enhygromyxa salina]
MLDDAGETDSEATSGSDNETSDGAPNDDANPNDDGDGDGGGDGGRDGDGDGDGGIDDDEPSCGDGNVDPGEFCFTGVELLDWVEIQSLAVGDFNGDGKLDIAVAVKDTAFVLLGDGTGSFPLQSELLVPDSDYRGVAAGDLDGDLVDDLVFARESNDSVLIYSSNSEGGGGPWRTYSVGDKPRAIALASLAEGHPLDVVVANHGDDSISTLFGQGMGLLGTTVEYDVGDEPNDIALVDFDHDTTLDLVVSNYGDASLSVLRGVGDGTFMPEETYPLLEKPTAFVTADLDQDGWLDVAAVLEGLDAVQLLFGEGAGSLHDSWCVAAVGDKPIDAAASDLNKDGAVDLIVANADSRDVGVLFGSSIQPEAFSGYHTLLWLSDFNQLTTVEVADLNADGVDDVLVAGEGLRLLISNP